MLVVFSQSGKWTGESACPTREQKFGMLIYTHKIHYLWTASHWRISFENHEESCGKRHFFVWRNDVDGVMIDSVPGFTERLVERDAASLKPWQGTIERFARRASGSGAGRTLWSGGFQKDLKGSGCRRKLQEHRKLARKTGFRRGFRPVSASKPNGAKEWGVERVRESL